ncbi:MAG TPA: hypothetical protein VKH41_07295 [Myxococcota bacterium]|nr:hypothetical protein [Myxococcota bacterium]
MRVPQLEAIARDAIARALWVPLAAALACAAPPAEIPITDLLASSAPQGGVRVSLVYGSEADLDLYVTGPAEETVYFANQASRDGGILIADRRCGMRTPRVETIQWTRAAEGRYRVGVDFMMRCRGSVDRARYELIAELPGQPPIRQHGEAEFGAFAPRVLEFEVPAR